MKKILFLFCVFVCLSAAQAQEYRITEAELERLENISTALEARSLSLLQQVQELTSSSRRLESKAQSLERKLQEAQAISKNLNELLQAERTTSQSLSASLIESEKEAAQLKEALSAEKLQHRKTRAQRNKLLLILIGEALLIVGFIVLKFIVRLKPF